MPELNLKDLRKDLRLPELRLPEMSRDDIAKALGEARKELRGVRKDIEDFRREFEMPRVDLAAVDMDKVTGPAREGAKQVTDTAKQSARQASKQAKEASKQVAKGAREAAESAGLVKPNRMRRMPFVLAGLVTIGLVAWALLNSPSVKVRLRDSAQRARERMNERRTAWDLDDDTRAFDAAKTAGVKSSAYSDSIDSADSPFAEPPAPLPEGLGTEGGARKAVKDTPARA
ncbi:MAG TPA: hypothetical protein VHK05_05795 [Candidatus Limnocylindrales bacterium]|jgi:hypothetical protein|nr:hypothetical protein [Candidatus Limnocylindrales bacterium]